MRIHLICAQTGKSIYGAIKCDILEFAGPLAVNGKPSLAFKTKDHGLVYCGRNMAERIRERLIANNMCAKVVEKALDDQFYKEIH